MNTYLYSKPSFTSPQPLAAASGLTIPLSLTLSEIKLSAFIILVFSKQKGLTLVFRNDPLESLKVSSTFDSIQFVRDYLQRTIEGKLRDLMMDELPAIIHRLSLQLWCPDQIPKLEEVLPKESDEPAVDPLASPPLDAVDANGNLIDPDELSSLAADGTSELPSLFSQKNLLRLAALTNSHRTLSLFTPGIRDVVVRAWAGASERHDPSGSPPLSLPSSAAAAASSPIKAHTVPGSATTYTFSDTGSQHSGYLPSRPSLVSLHSATTGLALGASSRHAKPGRRKKTRVVDLRRSKTASTATSEMGDMVSETASSVEGPMSEPLMPTASIPGELERGPMAGEQEEEEGAGVPTITAPSKMRFRTKLAGERGADLPLPPPPPPPARATLNMDLFENPEAALASAGLDGKPAGNQQEPRNYPIYPAGKGESSSSASGGKLQLPSGDRGRGTGPASDTSSVILEQAWIMKMAGEIARRVYDEKRGRRQHGRPQADGAAFWDEHEDTPPPAYEVEPQ